jgi:8-oxo-dGTP pyrophosphatase MutT (NUDIX family)
MMPNQSDNKAPIQRLNSRVAWSCPWYHVRQDDVRFPDGSEGVYNVVEVPDAVWVVPHTNDGRIVLIRNYRYTLGEWCWELPAGSIEDGQTALDAAQAELREEAGGESDDWQFLLRASGMNGIGNFYANLYLARGVRLQAPDHEHSEAIEVHPMAMSDALHLAKSGQMNDAISTLALLLAESHLLQSD